MLEEGKVLEVGFWKLRRSFMPQAGIILKRYASSLPSHEIPDIRDSNFGQLKFIGLVYDLFIANPPKALSSSSPSPFGATTGVPFSPDASALDTPTSIRFA